jgi:multiple sugar transport system permease protein
VTGPYRALRWFLAPSLGVLGLILLYPLGFAVYLSLLDYYLPRASHPFVGLRHYVDLLADPRFWNALYNTCVLAGASVALELGAGLLLALALYGLTAGARAYSVLLFLPHVVTPVVAGLLLRWMFVGRWGLIDATLASVGLQGPDWLGAPGWARATVVLADAWKFTPFVMLVLYAGLQSLDANMLEAAGIDGASGPALLRHVILPALRPLILFVLAIRLMDAFRFFDLIYVLTGGGPGTATETLTLYTYSLGFAQLELGKASALGVLTLLLVAALIGLLIRWLYRREQGAF